MKKILRCAAFLTLSLVAGAAVAQAPRPAKAGPTVAELRKNFARLAAGTEGESEAFINLMHTTPRRLVAYLKTHELSAAGATNMRINLSASSRDATHLKVFTYSYDSGGTRGTVHRPVLQWRNAAGQRFAYVPFEECDFTKIYKLASPGRTFYLLLGNDRGSGQCGLSQAYVIELKGNYLLLDAAAFDKSASLILCNVAMRFDPRRQVLRMTEQEYPFEPTAHDTQLKWQGSSFAETR